MQRWVPKQSIFLVSWLYFQYFKSVVSDIKFVFITRFLQVTLYKIKNFIEYCFFMSTIKFCYDKIILKQLH